MTCMFSNPPEATRRILKPFEVHVAQDELVQLQQLVRHARVAKPTYENQQDDRRYGITHQWLIKAQAQWEQFNWREKEQKINSFPHFIAHVGLEQPKTSIHLCALFSENPAAIPILLLHGWPGSFLEFLPMLNLLRSKYTPQSLPYHVIVPSLPGYVFSSGPCLDRDFGIEQAAAILDGLMHQLKLGPGYIAQGGDVGSKIARILAKNYDGCKAIHLNFCSMPPPVKEQDLEITEQELRGLERAREFEATGRGYAIEHATRPSTIAFVVNSSPLALLAIGEKFLDWSGEEISIETILESVTLYWFTETMSTSIYTYRAKMQTGNAGGHGDSRWNITKPLGYSYFPKEVAPMPISWVATTGDLVFSRTHEYGGHFAALEAPELLLQDLEEFVAIVWPQEYRG